MYLWYSKKKGVNVGNPRHKNTVSNGFCVATTGRCRPKVHVANVSPTFPAKEGEVEGEVEGEEGEEDCWAVLVIVISIILNQDTIGKL